MTFIAEKLILIHVPKSAGTSVKISLKKFTQEQIFPGIKNFTHQSFSQIININKTITHNRTSFAVVRNPYERFVSIYRFVNRPFKLMKWFGSKAEEVANNIDTFEKFIELFYMPVNLWQGKNHFTPQLEWVDCVECVFKIDEKPPFRVYMLLNTTPIIIAIVWFILNISLISCPSISMYEAGIKYNKSVVSEIRPGIFPYVL